MKKLYIVLFALILGISFSTKAYDFSSVNSDGDTIYYNINIPTATEPYTVSVTFNNSSNRYSGDISIPDSVLYNNIYYKVTIIDDNAFYFCSGLTSINIPLSVTYIGDNVFSLCTALTSVTIPKNIINSGAQVFKDCTSLDTVFFNAVNCNFMGYIGNYAIFLGCNNLHTIIIGDSVTKIPNSIFTSCTGLTSITIPSSVDTIGDNAFKGCSGLTSINIPPSVTSIGTGAFSGCSALQTLTIPTSITSLHEFTFNGCTSLRTFVIPTSLTWMDEDVFSNCINLDTIYFNATNLTTIDGVTFPPNSKFMIGDSVLKIPNNAFVNCIGMENITIPPSVTSIGNNSFMGCSGLTSINIASSVTSIGNYAFKNCSGLTSIKIPSSVTSIGNNAFKDCTSLDTVYYDAINCTYMGTTSLPVFNGCDNLHKIIIGDSVGRIPNYAFYGCTTLKSISFNSVVSTLGNSVFYNCKSLDSIIMPSSITNIGTYCFALCDSLKCIILPNTLTSLPEFTFQGCLSLGSINLPNSINRINNSVFSNCILLDSVILPTYLNYLGELIFNDCKSLTYVAFPNNLWNIPSGMFKGCTSLQTINIPSTVNNIGSFVFMNCTSLTSINLPNTLTSISSNLFKNCTSLSSINLPNALLRIYGYAFDSCTSLSKINIPNSVFQIFGNAFKNCYYLDTIIMNNPNPPTINYGAFLNVPNDVFISLPCNSYLNYQSANYWSNFTNFNELNTCLYTINVQSNNLSLGTVTGSGTYPFDTITITATPLQNCIFSRWQDGDTNSIRTVIVTKDSNFTAIFKQLVYSNISGSICQGQTYSFFENNLTTEGLYSHTITLSITKDSIINLQLIVNTTYSIDIYDTICEGESYTLNGFNFDTSGFYTLNLQTTEGCDSIVNLHLTVNPSFSNTIFAQICQGEVYSENGFNADSTGVYSLNFQSINGCDSIIYLNLIVNEIATPTNLTLNNIANYIELSWEGVGENYVIYRNNDSLSMTSIRIYQDSNVVEGVNYCYKIKAIDENCESVFSNQECQTFLSLNTISTNSFNAYLYPNPTDNKTTLRVEGLIENALVKIYDLTGRLIRNLELNANDKELEIEVQNLSKGVYNIRICNSTINITKKLIVN